MNRENAKDNLFAFVDKGLTMESISFEQAIDDIFDDFESRTCENCKWYDGSHKCNNENSIAHNSDNRVYTHDGCKEEFERKDIE